MMGLAKAMRLSALWERIDNRRDALRASFGLLSGVAMVAGMILGFLLPVIDEAISIEIPAFSFAGRDEARSLLETVATATVSVAGLTFSVTVVAFTLASNQLSPRVLRSFRSDTRSQVTLAVFLGTFVYCLAVLTRLGASGADNQPPNLSVTVALILAFGALAMFALFIAHIVSMLQPSSVIAAIAHDARHATTHIYPDGSAGKPEEPEAVLAEAERLIEAGTMVEVEAENEGYINVVAVESMIAVANQHDVLVRQRAAVGAYVGPGSVLADLWGEVPTDPDELAKLRRGVRGNFKLDRERGLAQDVAFPLRQLADIALKGLSPGVNDPTTGQNALESMTVALVKIARTERCSPVRVNSDGEPRFFAAAPSLDDLVRLGFEQPRIFAASYPTVATLMIELLARVKRAATEEGIECAEADRQIQLLRRGADGSMPTSEDVAGVQHAPDRPTAPVWR